ncbi:MAG: hypothetical protein KC482_08310 [Dehalococcoidia bacterium]|nr:hypothetical protein [Dehalococcoidia bacterium]MCA9844769.1 hypothetical protein [Dehalococcoidia bacterium]MCA9853587.1 hypothetical protein [Dehalococcoidia bacterium]
MNVEALPYTLLLVLAELAIGSLWVTVGSDLRGGVTRGFVMTMAFCIAITAALTYWTAVTIDLGTDVDGFQIDTGWFEPARRALLVVIGASVLYTLSAFMGWDPVGRLSGLVGSAAGLFAIICYAGMFAPPTWGYPAVLLALVGGTWALGAVSVSMTWGHWYLTEGRLPAWPLRDLNWVLLAGIGFQCVVVALNSVVPVREAPTPANALDTALIANPAFYLRLGVGLLFPGILAFLSLRTVKIEAMQSATGLLYIAMAAVFAGEVLSKGLMFVTGKPV